MSHFDGHVKRPRGIKLLRAADDLSVEIPGVPFKIGGIGKALRFLSEEYRYNLARWHWLRPNSGGAPLSELPRIQEVAGLADKPENKFSSELSGFCQDFMREHAELRLWIRRRLILLDYRLNPPVPFSPDLPEIAAAFNFQLLSAQNLLWQDTRKAMEEAALAIKQAMEGAARAAAEIFSRSPDKHGYRFNANLMVPLRLPPDGTAPFPFGSCAEQNHKDSQNLWEDVSGRAERALVVVAETLRAQHRGFWIPLVPGDSGAQLPGAPKAMNNLTGDAVFTDDVPPIEGFPAALNHRWKAYMTSRFTEKVFVSLPFCVASAAGGRAAVAVLNVNASPPDQDGWFRAYHQEWLEPARRAVAPFAQLAHHGYMILQQTGLFPRLDSGLSEWDALPAIQAPVLRLPPGASLALLESGDEDEP